MPKMRGMHANLVGAPGFDTHLGIAVPTAALDQLEVTDRILALGIDPHHALAAGQYRFLHRHVPAEAFAHPPHPPRQVTLATAPSAPLPLPHHRTSRRAPPRHPPPQPAPTPTHTHTPPH